jgi:hypothetical protein
VFGSIPLGAGFPASSRFVPVRWLRDSRSRSGNFKPTGVRPFSSNASLFSGFCGLKMGRKPRRACIPQEMRAGAG